MTSAGALAHGIGYVAGGLAGLGCLYLLAMALLVLRFRRKSRSDERGEGEALPPVTVLVPLCGDEPGLAGRLRGLRHQVYPAPVQIVCGVREAGDSALAPARSVAAEDEGRPIDIHVDPRLYGRNLKISNLINMMEHARHDVLVMIDSDMDVAPDYLVRVVAELARPGVGAVTCLYHGVAGGGIAARLSAMGINLHFLPNVVFGMAVGMARPCFGATIAISRAELALIGGLRAFADQLWDDYAIGWAVRAAGHDVAVSAFAPGHVCTETSAHRLFATQLRAARTVRGIDPAGHAGAIVTHPFPLALIAFCFSWAWWALTLAVAALVCRAVLALCVTFRFGAPRPAYTLVALRDLLSFAIYVASYLSATVEWRGQRYRIEANGTLIPTANRG